MTGTDGSIIDRAALARMLELVGNDRDVFAELLDEFFVDAPGFIVELGDALEQGDANRIRITAHSFKSNSASFGALALTEQCRALEALGKSGDLDGAAGRIAQIETEYARARDELQAIRTTV